MTMQYQNQAPCDLLCNPLPESTTGMQGVVPSTPLPSAAGDNQQPKRSNLCGESSLAAIQNQAQRCPRCSSLNTKFCYYNNYSFSQPRHFCKDCRRYWTKGGTLRDVPVGGGCRKNKRSTSVKDRSADALTSLMSLDGSTAKILPNINNTSTVNYKGEGNLMPNFSTLSLPTSTCWNSKQYTSAPTFSQLQESMSLMAGEASSSQNTLFNGGRETGSSLFTSLYTPPLPSSISAFNPLSLNVQWNCSTHDRESDLMFHETERMATDLCLFSSQAATLGAFPPVTPNLEDHASVFSASSVTEGSTLEKMTYGSLPFQVGTDQNLDTRRHALVVSSNCKNEEEITSVNGRMTPFTLCPNISYWTDEWDRSATPESVFPTAAEPTPKETNLCSAAWTELHAAVAGAGSTTIGALLH